jgi:hypothetical protein
MRALTLLGWKALALAACVGMAVASVMPAAGGESSLARGRATASEIVGQRRSGALPPARVSGDRDSGDRDSGDGGRRLRVAELSGADRSLVNRKRNVPRRDIKFKTVPRDFVVEGAAGRRYLESMAMLVAFGALAGVLSLLMWPVFTLPRACCGAFGGSRPRTDTGADKYSSGARTRHVIAMAVVIVVVVGASVLGFTGSAAVGNGFDEFFDSIEGAGVELKGKATSISAKLTAAAELRQQQGGGGASTPGADEALRATADLTISVDDTLTEVRDVRTKANKVDKLQRYFVYATIAASLISTLVLGGWAAIAGKRFPALVMVHCCFLTAFVVWLSFGVMLSIGTATADLCIDLEGFIVATSDGPSSTTTTTTTTTTTGGASLDSSTSGAEPRGIEQVLGCVTNGTAASSFGFADEELQDTAREINRELEDLGYTGTVELDPNSTDYEALQRNMTRIKREVDDGGFLPPATQGAQVSRLSGNVDAGLGYIEVLIEIQELLRCGIVRDAYDSVEKSICGTMLRGLDRLLIAAGLIAVSLWLGVIVAARGSKRFPRENCYTSSEQAGKRLDNGSAVTPVPAYNAPGQFVQLPDELEPGGGHSRRHTVTNRRNDASSQPYVEIEMQDTHSVESGGTHPPAASAIDAAPVTGFDSQGSYIAPPIGGREF